jgi:hypothetical protein
MQCHVVSTGRLLQFCVTFTNALISDFVLRLMCNWRTTFLKWILLPSPGYEGTEMLLPLLTPQKDYCQSLGEQIRWTVAKGSTRLRACRVPRHIRIAKHGTASVVRTSDVLQWYVPQTCFSSTYLRRTSVVRTSDVLQWYVPQTWVVRTSDVLQWYVPRTYFSGTYLRRTAAVRTSDAGHSAESGVMT